MATNITSQPPYVSYGIFTGTNEKLAETTVPSSPLDRRVLDWLSGADYGALMSGLKYLGLVDDEKRATAKYRDLVIALKSDPAGRYKQTLRTVLDEAYTPVLVGFDWENGTASELERRFKDAGVSQGQMLTKTVRFAIKATQDVGVQVSPHITKPKAPRTAAPKKNGEREKTRQQKPSNSNEHHGPREDHAPSSHERLPIPGVVGAYIQYPRDLMENDCALFEAMVGVLRTYVKGRAGKKDK